MGTSALRDAMNGEVFAQAACAGWHSIGTWKSSTESRRPGGLIEGVALTLTANRIARIGDGHRRGKCGVHSHEAEGRDGQWVVEDLVSLNVGVARLAEFGKPADPLTAAGEERYREFLEDAMAPVRRMIAAHSPVALVGSSGSFDTFSEMINGPVPRI